ncbi:hypothetical protein FR943_03415 [Mycobacterium sp. TNTM28]|uniref:Uncharacterized protein n=1 Tax=[Mycobacterium] fortunisiensis TaxID=2600579 RepID=A0ABS6KH97_9MYCO|nr:hypothetical protein [[Mycobacterium] fortunisiensis]
MSLFEPSVLTSITSAVTDLIVGESGPSKSMTPAPANARLANPAVAIEPAGVRRPCTRATLCFPTVFPICSMNNECSVNGTGGADTTHLAT